ncbi:hypothetical protein B0J15DRAFT_507723 [Fusarium solani]|uniref:Uncharacterized protein n=1 Tax=Fusarium solani TaxID=169388 RepID=A0A9P9L388_FUSSL|nr:uncharacterized protein B0J15DRAFT_507723 [Fusarium solani]KAH7273346.1 hypothetical protein B0J15DRAFT_507723 [Fusarium solani]
MSSSSPVWLITGAGTGFGKAIALSALKRGHRVVAAARRLSVLSDLVGAGPHTMVLDVTIPEDDIAAKVKEAHDRRCLTSNTNVFGTIKLCRAVIPYFRAQSHGGIANFGSLGSWVGSPATSFYNATKWAVFGFTEALAAELKPFGIVVTSVEPGQFRTAFFNADKCKKSARRMEDVYANTSAEEYGALLDAADNNQPGDVDRGAEIVVDVLTMTGLAEGKEVSVRLVLGKDCLNVVRSNGNEWEGVAVSTDRTDLKL